MNIANILEYKTAKLVNLVATTLIRAFLSIPFVKSAEQQLNSSLFIIAKRVNTRRFT